MTVNRHSDQATVSLDKQQANMILLDNTGIVLNSQASEIVLNIIITCEKDAFLLRDFATKSSRFL